MATSGNRTKYLVTYENDDCIFFKNDKCVQAKDIPEWIRVKIVDELLENGEKGEAYVNVNTDKENTPHKIIVYRQPYTKTTQNIQIEGIRFVPDLSKEYIVKEKIGEGNFGEVYKAIVNDPTKRTRSSKHTVVALKKLTNASIESLKNEFSIMKNLSAPESVGGAGCHVGIVCYYDLFHTDENGKPVLWVVMQFLEGTDLFEVFKANRGKPLKTNELTKLMKHLLIALDYIHSRGVAHLDLKPENIRMSDNKFYIIDFGLSCMPPIKKCVPVGTPVYMSPDMFATRLRALSWDKFPTDQYMKADIWSLGVIFLEMATGFKIDDIWPDQQAFEEKYAKAMFESSALPGVPINTFEKAFKRMDQKVASIIGLMLTADYKNRPSASELLTRLKSRLV